MKRNGLAIENGKRYPCDRHPPEGILFILVAIALFIAGLWSVPLALFGPDRTLIPGDMGDARFNNWILEHFHKYVTGKVGSFWDAPFMYPWKNAIALSDNLLGSAPIYSALRYLGQTREGAFQGWIVAMFALNYGCCFVAMRKWAGNSALAACASYIFAFGIYNIGQLNNLQVLPRYMAPLALVSLWSHLHSGSWKALVLAMCATVYQFYCGIYIGFILVYALFFLLVGHLLIFRDPGFLKRFTRWRFTGIWFGTVLIGLLMLAPMIKHYLAVPEELGVRTYADIFETIPRPSSYFFTHPAAMSWRSLYTIAENAFPQWWYHLHFLGALPWLAVLGTPFMLLSKRMTLVERRTMAAAVSALVLSTLFCLNIGGFSLYKLVFMLPGFSVLRAIDRFINVQVLFFLIVFVLVLRPLFQRRRTAWALSLLLPVMVVQDNRWEVGYIDRYDKHVSERVVADVERRIARELDRSGQHDAVAYEPALPIIRDFEEWHTLVITTQINAMLAGQELGIPVVNAYSGGYPGNYIKFFDAMDHGTMENWCAFNGIGTERIQEIDGLAVDITARDTVRIIAANGLYLCADRTRGNTLLASRERADEWETFLRLRTVDGRVAFLASDGGFLCAELDQHQQLAATAADLGDYGLFTVVPLDNDQVALRAFNGRYLELDSVSMEMSAKANDANRWTRFRVVKP